MTNALDISWNVGLTREPCFDGAGESETHISFVKWRERIRW